MPTYEYECKKCGHIFEAFQSMTEAPVKKCPECSGQVKRLISSGAGLIFKGSGFYITDYKKAKTVSNETKSSDTNKGESSKSKTDDKKSDTKDTNKSEKKE